MRYVFIDRYINLGEIWWFLMYGSTGREVKEVKGYINTLFGYLDEFRLPVTKRAATELEEFANKLAEKDDSHIITVVEQREISRILEYLEKTLMAEAKGNIVLLTTDKRIDVNKLLFKMSDLMSPGTFNALPQIAQYDFTEAGYCIAFERSTAAAFHMLRGTEAVLKEFYCKFVKTKRVDLMWGPMVTHLKSRRIKPPVILLNNLDNIRESFRNPTAHPEKVYDIEEVQDLFSLCVDVINRMCKIIEGK